MDDQLKQGVLDFHEFPIPGKIQVSPTKSLVTQRDPALAYSSGVVTPCPETEKDPLVVYKYTVRGNLVAVISNGIAMPGLGNTGALADKLVMGGEGALFKKFAGVDVLDIEVDESDSDKFTNVVATLGLTSGGISLEDIEVPECFYIEQKLRECMSTPVSHDDQYGTAIISTAATLSGPWVVERNIPDVRMVVPGAGVVAIACMNLLVALGMQRHNTTVCSSEGVIYKGHELNMAEIKVACVMVDDGKYTLDDVIDGADIFLSCSGPKALAQGMAKKMARAPMILTLTNPRSETLLPLAKEVYSDVIIYTGRSNYPNQANNVPCFPLIFRDVPDVGATVINEEVKLAAVHATAELAHAEQSEAAAPAYDDQDLSFDPEYITPKPFDPRLVVKTVPVVAKAAMGSGVATRPIVDFDTHIDRLIEFVCKISLFMKPTFSLTRGAPGRVVLIEGEEARALCVTQELITLGLAEPTSTGCPSVVETRIQKLGLQTKAGVDFEIVNSESDPRSKEYWDEYYQITKRCGTIQEQAQHAVITNTMVIGVIMAQRGEADTMIRGTVGDYHEHFNAVKEALGHRDGVHTAGMMNTPSLPSGNTFTVDTHTDGDPTPEQLTEIVMTAAKIARRFGVEPKAVLLSHSNLGSSNCPSTNKVRDTLEPIKARAPELMIDGEIHGDAVLVESICNDRISDDPLKGSANTLAMPDMGAARISYNLLRVSNSEGVTVGPVLVGVTRPVRILTSTASVRHTVNMVALAAVEIQTRPL